MSKVGFVTMGESAGGEDIPTVGIGMLGYGFMGKAHSNAYKTLAYMTWPPPLMPQLVAIAGRNEDAVSEAARRYGFSEYVTDWKALIGDDRIQLFDNAGPNNLHEWGTTEGNIWRFDKATAGSGSLGDLGAHVIDLSRYLVGEITEVAAMT